MSNLKTVEPSKDEIGIMLIWRPKSKQLIDVLDKKSGRTMEVYLDCVSKGNGVILHPNGKLHTLEDLQIALSRLGKKFSLEHVKRQVDHARERFGTKQWLYCSFRHRIYHGESILKFLGKEDAFEIFRQDDKEPYRIKVEILNQYWRSKGLPFAYVRKKIILEEA